MKGIK